VSISFKQSKHALNIDSNGHQRKQKKTLIMFWNNKNIAQKNVLFYISIKFIQLHYVGWNNSSHLGWMQCIVCRRKGVHLCFTVKVINF